MTDARHGVINELLLACSVGDLSWLQKGLASGINPRATNREGLNGLHLTAKNGHFACLKYLLNNSSLDVNTATNSDGVSPLHCSLMANNAVKMYQCTKLLLDRGADSNIKDALGQSVLHYAAKSGNIKCLKLLLESGVNIHEEDDKGKTAYEVACIHNKYESVRLLRALQWAHNKDTTRSKKLKEDYLLQKREAEEKALEAQLQAERAEAAYNTWLEKKDIKNRRATPEQCEKRVSNPKDRRSSCTSCASSKQRGSSTISGPKCVASIKISHHQEKKNLDSVGKPDKMQPYTNYRPKSRSLQSATNRSRSGSQAHSRCSSRTTYRSSATTASGTRFYAKKLRPGAKQNNSRRCNNAMAESGRKSDQTIVSNVPGDKARQRKPQTSFKLTEQHATTTGRADPRPSTDAHDKDSNSDDSDVDLDELDFSKLTDSNSALAYPQFDFIEDDASLFHDVGELNSLDSLALPAMLTKDRTPAEVLQLLRHLGRSENNKILRRSKSFSYGGKQFHSHFRRRLSLGSIPEGRILTDYTEEEEEEEGSDIDSQLLRDLEKSICAISDTEGEKGATESEQSWSKPPANTLTCTATGETAAGRELHSPLAPPQPSSPEDVYESESFSMLLPNGVKTAPPQTLKIVNLAWDTTVQSHMSETPITSPGRSSYRAPSPTQSSWSRQQGSTSPCTDTSPRNVATPPLEISSHRIDPSPREATSPTRTPSRRVTPPFRKVTPPSHRSARKLTPPPNETLQHHSSTQTVSSGSLDISRVCLTSDPRQRLFTPPHSPGDHPSPPSLSPNVLSCPSTPMFYIGDPEDSETHPVKSHSLFSLSTSAMSKSTLMCSSDLEAETSTKKMERSVSAPLMKYLYREHSTNDV